MLNRGIHGLGGYTQSTPVGTLQITIAAGGVVFMEQPKQTLGEYVGYADITNALGVSSDSFDKSFKPQIVRGNLLFGVSSKGLLNKLKLNRQSILDFGEVQGFDCIHVFTLLEGNEALAAVRNFDPAEGIDEDIASGTTNGSLLAYLNNHHALPKQGIYKIEQGETLGRLSFVYGKLQDGRVWIGGTSIENGRCQFELP